MVINDLKVGVIIQARTNSTRLPNKIFLKLPYNSNYTVLDQIVSRVKKVKNIDEIIIATSNNVNDDKIESFCKKKTINCYRGSERNVLSRFYYCSKKYNFDIIIRLTGDNPCIDPNIIKSTLNAHIQLKNDYTKTENYPLGTNIEIISFSSLEKSFKNSKNDFEKEHVTPYIWKTKPNEFKIKVIKAPKELSRPEIRVTLDTLEDYVFICCVYDYYSLRPQFFSVKDIISLAESKPWLLLINKNVVQKNL